jgi:predicted acylesterase/phospholipase RssA
MSRVAVALSGGGHRAALFGLGALLYLVDAGKNREVGSIASVSGGSLTNAYIAQSIDYRDPDPARFREQIAPFARQMAQKGTVWPPSALTVAYLLLLVVVALGLIAVWFLPWPVGLRVLAFLLVLVLLGVVASWRGLVISRAFARTLYSPTGKPTKLESIGTTLDHVICAADLHAGENVYFSGGFVCSYRFGWGSPGDLPLHVAVQCSAALPGVAPPRWLSTGRHGFVDGQEEARGATRMGLVDGGVYDNMADQWGLGMRSRKERWPELAKDLRDLDELIIVNASAGLEWTPIWKMRLPLVGEILALLRDKTMLYDNGNTVRREWALDRFRSHRPPGVLVHVPRSPLYAAERYASGSDEVAMRAQAVLELLEPERADWEASAKRSATASTGLSPTGTALTVDLLRHGYVLAMANLHVILGYPLLDVPSRGSLEALVR